MGDTTSNEGRGIATKGSSHIAQATAPDMCFVPGIPVPQPFPNFVPTTRLAAGQTTVTFIEGKPIVTSRGEIGPLSDPAHAGVNGGVSSGTYRFEAQATTYSSNVFFENSPAVRTVDLTTQNHGNTVGLIMGSNYQAELDALREENQIKCVIIKLEGQDGDGRKLGFPGKKQADKEPNYLEILSTDTVTLNSTRVDMTKSPNLQNPACRLGSLHTRWHAAAKTKPSEALQVKGPESGEQFQVPGALAYDSEIYHSDQTTVGNDTGSAALFNLVLFFIVKSSPPSIQIEALACGGAKTAQLKVFPAREFEMELSAEVEDEEGGKKHFSAVNYLKVIADGAQRIANFLGGKFEAKLLHGLKCTAKAQYKKCGEEKQSYFGSDWYSPARVGLDWEVSFASDPLIAVSGRVSGPLAALAGPLGAGFAEFLRWLKVATADVFIEAEVSCSVSVVVGRDIYDYPTNTGGKFGVGFSVSGGVEVTVGDFTVLEAKIEYPSDFSIGLLLGDRPDVLLQLAPEGSCGPATISLTAFKDSWIQYKDQWKFESTEFTFESKRIDLLTVTQ